MRYSWWLGGVFALCIIVIMTLLPMLAIFREAGALEWSLVGDNIYLQRVIRFSFYQATLSTLLALITAIPVALALSHQPQFKGRSLLVTLFSLSLVIPTITAIYGIVAVYGRTGWLNDALAWLAVNPLELYGLPGILIAHVFFNMPLATRILLTSLEAIPDDNWRLCRQLGMTPWAIFHHIEWPRVKSQLPGLALLIFTLCFTSFAIVMTLGGGPRSTTIEVAVYQALRFDFDIKLATALASIQLVICLALMLLSTTTRHNASLGFRSIHSLSQQTNNHDQQAGGAIAGLWQGMYWTIAHWSTLFVAALFVLLPLLALLISAINSKTLAVLNDSATLHALGNTLKVSLTAACLSVLLSILLLSSIRHLRIRLQRELSGQWLQLTGNIILVLPPLVLGTGLFLLLRPFADVFSIALILVIIINSLMALPFTLRILDGPVMNAASQQDHLLQSLGIDGLNRWRFVDWPQLRKPIALSLALSSTLAAGDLSAIALFGSERINTLPLLLYQRMGSYRLEEAAVTAGILLLTCLFLFAGIQRLLGGRPLAPS